ncbi:hypothetical protein L1267_10820 [Pseudoalteromonas sp. OFAV1]|uniref:hypothetical protein n=1 Tax=Pseudoalteromonas sp. OFAV1 TaxID=2908892 RepID=UPI001F40CE4C|nr:hypothetical protein [Pseudoalteromonas sp. OFAV1]MCF2900895.1 hypothetical protein [Pseudoalteromonas sp. OFAV1]
MKTSNLSINLFEHDSESPNKQAQKLISVIQFYRNRLVSLGLDKAASAILFKSDGKLTDPNHINSDNISNFQIEIPNAPQFKRFLTAIKQCHNVEVPKLQNDSSSDQLVNEFRVGVKHYLSPKEDKDKEELLYVIKIQPDLFEEFLEEVREEVVVLTKRQDELLKRKNALIKEYMSTGDEGLFRDLISLNEELTELCHQQENIIDLCNDIFEFALDEIKGSEPSIELLKSDIGKNTLNERNLESILINTSELRKSFDPSKLKDEIKTKKIFESGQGFEL